MGSERTLVNSTKMGRGEKWKETTTTWQKKSLTGTNTTNISSRIIIGGVVRVFWTKKENLWPTQTNKKLNFKNLEMLTKILEAVRSIDSGWPKVESTMGRLSLLCFGTGVFSGVKCCIPKRERERERELNGGEQGKGHTKEGPPTRWVVVDKRMTKETSTSWRSKKRKNRI